MTYSVETTPEFDKEFKKLDRPIQKILKVWIDKNLVDCENPRQHGKGLTANFKRALALSCRQLPHFSKNRG